MSTDNRHIDNNIRGYKKKYFRKRLLNGTAIFLAIITVTFLTFALIEHFFRLNQVFRAILFFGFIISAAALAYHLIIRNILEILVLDRKLSDEAAARNIGLANPAIGDRLLNLIQLKSYGTNSLAQASILQRAGILNSYDFSRTIDFTETIKYWRVAAAVLLSIAFIYLINPSIIRNSPERIIKYNQQFIPEAPFTFNTVNNEVIAFKNEDYTVQVKIEGEALPSEVYLDNSSRRIKMEHAGNQIYTHTFPKIQQDARYTFEAAGYQSRSYDVTVVNRPQLGDFNVIFEYPAYLNRNTERLENTGHLQVPEGTKVQWQMQPRNADEISMFFTADADTLMSNGDDSNGLVYFEKQLRKSSNYEVRLKNEYSLNKEPIIYHAEVIPDRFPEINVNIYQDTIMYSFVMMSGNINDDHGLTRLLLNYRINSNDNENQFSSINIPIASRQNSQSFSYEWLMDSLNIQQGAVIEYFLQVWDNDGVNGRKSSKTGTYTLRVPNKNALKEELSKNTEQTEEKIDKTLEEARDLNKKIEESTQKLRGKKNLNWQDEKNLKELLEKREELNKALEELKKQHSNQEMKRDRFNPDNEKTKEKVEQLQKMMDELLDEETLKLYEELQKLLEDQKNMDHIQDMLEKMKNKERNLEKELERTLELFKKLKFDHKLQENIDELDELSEEQKEMSEETMEKENSTEKLKEKQEKLKEKFEEFKEDMDEMQQLNQERNQPQALPEDLKEQQEKIEQQMNEAQEQLKENKRKKSQEAQDNAAKEMKKMQEQLSQMQSSMEMEMMMENMEDLRHIVHNLLKLSFDQEALMKEFAQVQQTDPRFIALAQQQLKIADDSRIIEDSLHALAKRVFQIQSFVTRELSEMNSHMDKATKAIKERKKPVAVAEQQFTMTSMNNLALLLDDVLQQMQNALSEAMGVGKPSSTPSEGQSLGEQQQQLNQEIQQLKESGKTGKQLSEELARLAAEQERIRQALQEMQEKFGEEGENGEEGGNLPGQGIPEKMKETEKDLVNKKLTEEMIKRQEDIVVRLLQAEKSMRERELDDERKGETAKPIDRDVPALFEEYFKQKQQEIELLKTIPPKLFPYYRKEVNEYFKRIGDQS